MVRTGARDDRIQTGPAKTQFIILEPVHSAFAGTDTAAFEKPVGLLDAMF
jgi:hypothetical protein